MALAYLVRTAVEKRLVRTGSVKRIVRTTVVKNLVKNGGVVNLTIGQSTIEFLGSAMTGTDGQQNRSYTYTTSFPANAKVYVGSTSGTMRLPSTKFSRSTVTVANDTITIGVAVYNEDQVMVDL